jgi:hypothetical protein
MSSGKNQYIGARLTVTDAVRMRVRLGYGVGLGLD